MIPIFLGLHLLAFLSPLPLLLLSLEDSTWVFSDLKALSNSLFLCFVLLHPIFLRSWPAAFALSSPDE